MNPEREVLWCSKLYVSKACKDPITLSLRATPLCKKDFERLVGAPENSKEFNLWFNKLLSNKVLEFAGMIMKGERGNVSLKSYIAHAGMIVRYLESHEDPEVIECYQAVWKFMNRGRVI